MTRRLLAVGLVVLAGVSVLGSGMLGGRAAGYGGREWTSRQRALVAGSDAAMAEPPQFQSELEPSEPPSSVPSSLDPSVPESTSVPSTVPPALLQVRSVQQLAQLTGANSVNETHSRWNVYGTDLGHMFEHRGALYMVFGDTFGPLKKAWRSNVMARLESADPRHGLRFASMISAADGTAAELLSSLKIDGREKTVIPTYGTSIGGRMILHYMSVRDWGAPGQWALNYSGLAYSDDDGLTWVKDSHARWRGDSNFGQVAMVPVDGMVYVFGIPGGRFGGAQLARVAEADLLRLDAWQYWNGLTWTADPGAAIPVVPAPVGELSVRWSESQQRWLMMYFNESTGSIVLRTAPLITGPWGPEQIVVSVAEYSQLYAPYMVPGDTGNEIYFTMSQYEPYQVFLMKATLG